MARFDDLAESVATLAMAVEKAAAGSIGAFGEIGGRLAALEDNAKRDRRLLVKLLDEPQGSPGWAAMTNILNSIDDGPTTPTCEPTEGANNFWYVIDQYHGTILGKNMTKSEAALMCEQHRWAALRPHKGAV